MANIQNNVVLVGTSRYRMNFGLHHLLGACHNAARLHQLGHDHAGQPYGEFWEEMLHCALGVTTSTVASLESFANEMLFEGGILKGKVTDAAATQIVDVIDKETVLRKYAIGLSIRTDKVLDRGTQVFQDVDALIKLRNAVVHFRPEWADAQQEHAKVSKYLQHRFTPSPYHRSAPLFPSGWVSADFSTWALKSTVNFLDYFYGLIEMECPLEKFRSRLHRDSGGLLY